MNKKIVTFNKGDKVVIKRGHNFIEARIVKVVKPYHGKDYYLPDKTKYFCSIKNSQNNFQAMTEAHLESDLVNWQSDLVNQLKQSSRTNKLKELGI